MTKKKLLFCIQACINCYNGEHGEVKKIFEITEQHDIDNVEFYFGFSNKKLYIVFRGTDEKKDWKQNFDIKSIDIMGGKIHLGFFEDYQKTMRIIYKEIHNYQNIVITGHSKGACQAIVQTFMAQKYFPKKHIECIAVAPAKCISKKINEQLKNTYSIINGDDYICKIPPFKFRHAGKVIKIGKRTVCGKIPIVRICGVKDHYPQLYLENMKKFKHV